LIWIEDPLLIVARLPGKNNLVDSAPQPGLTRRFFLAATTMPVVAGLVPAPAIAKARAQGLEQVLAFRHQHTGEQLKIVYKADGRYVRENLRRIDRLLRDWRTGQIKPIDPKLLDVLWDLQAKLETRGVIEVLSGFRAPRTNAMLRRKSEGVAKNSFHLKGKAIDLRIEGCTCRQVRKAAVAMARGGVGYYPTSNFVHLDTGAPRSWAWS
jgi:uncharacterized protein YcbK (DUF882 family)